MWEKLSAEARGQTEVRLPLSYQKEGETIRGSSTPMQVKHSLAKVKDHQHLKDATQGCRRGCVG